MDEMYLKIYESVCAEFEEATMNIRKLDTIDEIATDLLEIEESAIFALGLTRVSCGDELLHEINMPVVADLMHISCES